MGMNVVNSGDIFQIYGDAIKTYNQLPAETYELRFSKNSGFFLAAHNDLTVNEEKIYGSIPTKVEKVLRSFRLADRNFGVILSGRKGAGKSLFARQLAVKAKENQIPLIIVSGYIPGIAGFISSIEQEVIVLFDEFEKTFAEQDDHSPQEEMLPLFDGIDGGKKLFVVTCNETNKLNTYLLNRPGRFHYHFIINSPNADEIRDYMTDKLLPQYHDSIQETINLSMTMNLTYDILRAVVFELNNGYSLQETLLDLNISKEGKLLFDVRVEFEDGSYRVSYDCNIDLSKTSKCDVWLDARDTNYNCPVRISFYPSDIVPDSNHNCLIVDPSRVSRYVDEDYFEMNDPKEKELYDYLCNAAIKKVAFVKSSKNTGKYMI